MRHDVESLCSDNDPRCHMRKIKIISSDWIALLRRLLITPKNNYLCPIWIRYKWYFYKYRYLFINFQQLIITINLPDWSNIIMVSNSRYCFLYYNSKDSPIYLYKANIETNIPLFPKISPKTLFKQILIVENTWFLTNKITITGPRKAQIKSPCNQHLKM